MKGCYKKPISKNNNDKLWVPLGSIIIMVLYSSFSNHLVNTNTIYVLIIFYFLMNIIILCVTNS